MQRRRAGELLLAGALVQSAGRAAAHKWHLIRHHNCFNHNGGYRVSDLVNPFEEPITLQECQKKCEDEASCSGVITIRRHSEPGQPPEGPCWLRTDVKPKECFYDTSEPWDLHVLEGRGVDLSGIEDGSMGDSSVDPDHHRHSSPYELFGHVGAIIIASFASSTSTSWENARALLVPLLAILLIFLLLVICCLTSLVLREAGLIRKARKEDDARQPALSESDKVVFAEMDADGDGVITKEEFQDYQDSHRKCQTSCW